MAKGLIEQESLTNIANAIRSKNGKTMEYTPAEMPAAIMDISGLDGFPIGGITAYGGTVIPDGWLLCDGSTVSRELYSDLFKAVGTVFGEGDGLTTFALPNLSSKFIYGTSDAATVGDTGGEEAHTLTIGEMPPHSHEVKGSSNNAGGYSVLGQWNGYASAAVSFSSGLSGGGQAHNNMPPYIKLYYIIKASQQTPIQAVVEDSLSSTSTTNALSANMGKVLNDKITPTVLFEGSSYEEITLSDSASNYSYLDVYTVTEPNELLPLTRIEKGQTLFRLTYSRYDTGITVQSKVYSISGNKITPTAADRLYVNSANTVAYTSNSLESLSRIIKIIKVVGYK